VPANARAAENLALYFWCLFSKGNSNRKTQTICVAGKQLTMLLIDAFLTQM